jgi:hypothetical protein
MDESIKQHYLADSPPTVVRLEVKPHFDTLKDQNLRKYAHFMSRYGVPVFLGSARSTTSSKSYWQLTSLACVQSCI